MQILDRLTYINNSSLALGYFDGIHAGHRVVLNTAVREARKNNTKSVVILFKTHPLTFLTGQNIEHLLSFNERLEMLDELGVDNVIALDFKDYAFIEAKKYLEDILVKYFSPIAITTGFNHFFGANKEGNSELLRNCQNKFNYRYYEIPPYTVNSELVSCSNIRNLIKSNNLYEANKLLGYDFFITGEVIKGEMIASKLGFASANVLYPKDKINMPFGVYFVKVKINTETFNGILNHGCSPTFNKQNNVKTEVHLIDFDKDIYGKKIKISFVRKIREQIKFENIDKLKEQINRDMAIADMYDRF